MYVTRPLSLYRNSPSSLSSAPPEGPNSGILVIQDEEPAETRWCCGLFKTKESVKELPFPQNKILRLTHAAEAGEIEYSESVRAVLIPVLNLPLSSNQYYIINSHGTRKGLACTSSKEEETSGRCCYSVLDPPPQLFDPKNAYQQFQISDYIYCGGPNGYITKSMAPDGVPPKRLSRKGLRAYTQPLKNFEPTEALGLNPSLRGRLPEIKSSDPVVVGKWYCPFIFIREGDVSSQMSNSPYYEMTLRRDWFEIFGCESSGEGNNGVDVDVYVEREVASVAGGAAARRRYGGDGFVWFEAAGVGLSTAIVERVKWEEGREGFGWVEEGEEKKIRVRRREELKGVGIWRRFGCYVLVERFVLKRMDGSVVLTWEFRHTHQLTTKWE
ncbi:uncharacterized protein LOC111449654 [Cucurbita moschata]|uniref:Uncharacterized protein LOC111449654 n=1 Tax=Cucurbita moschata TaxID=3662 RepID=A0A6J1G0V4_CUCMO|nr:uncharacterized protein LOC111449654 [Cucurbita moschata]